MSALAERVVEVLGPLARLAEKTIVARPIRHPALAQDAPVMIVPVALVDAARELHDACVSVLLLSDPAAMRERVAVERTNVEVSTRDGACTLELSVRCRDVSTARAVLDMLSYWGELKSAAGRARL
jgi:hypothetical protein